MVSLSPYGMPLVYPSKHGANMSYPTASWYPNYPPHHMPPHPNNQFLNSTAGQMDDPAALYNAHHHMLHQASSDWNTENFGVVTSNSHGFSQGTPSSSHLSPQSVASQNTTPANGEPMRNMANVPPSPPTTVNSGCSDMSSPGLVNGMNMSMTDEPPSNVSSEEQHREKEPYGWMKKPMFASLPQPGMCLQHIFINSTRVALVYCKRFQHF